MALADLDAYLTQVATPKQTLPCRRSGSTTAQSNTWMTFWTRSPDAGSAPSTAATCDSTTAGGIPRRTAAGSGAQFVAAVDLCQPGITTTAVQPSEGGCWVLLDRLSHQGGLVGNSTSLQTTNLPTAALTRYTSGVGVWVFAEIYSSIGLTAADLSITYTNQDGTGSRTGRLVAVGSSLSQSNTALPIALQAGDTGVRSVESVQFATAPGSAGNWGITLAKPLLMIPAPNGPGRADLLSMVGLFSEILDDACLVLANISNGNITDQQAVLHLGEF